MLSVWRYIHMLVLNEGYSSPEDGTKNSYEVPSVRCRKQT